MKKHFLLIAGLCMLTACATLPKKISQEEQKKVDGRVGLCVMQALFGGENNILSAMFGGGEGGSLKLTDKCRKELDGHSMYGKCVRQELEKGFGMMPKLEKPDAKTGVSGRNKCLQYVEDEKATVMQPKDGS